MNQTVDFQVDFEHKPEVMPFFDEPTSTFSYVVKDPGSNACAVVDSVMDIDYAAGRLNFDGADRIIDYIRNNGLELEWLIETHVHADHLSASPYIQENWAARSASVRKSSLCRKPLARFSMSVRSSSVTARNSTISFPTVSHTA